MNAALVKIDVAAAALGWSAAKLFDLVDGPGRTGDLIEKGFVWVFNLANDPQGDRRDLRFWLPEVQARLTPGGRSYGHWEIEYVIKRVLPEKRANFHAGEVDQLFQIRPRTRIDLHADLSGTLEGGRNFYSRAALAAFLKRRWLGALYERGTTLPKINPSPLPASPATATQTRKHSSFTAPASLSGAATLANTGNK